MKNLFLIALITSIASVVQAQPAKVVSAYRYLQDFEISKDAESLVKAKEAIDQASIHEKTIDDAKTFAYKGQIYLSLFDNNHRVSMDNLVSITDPNKKTLTAYQNTSANELDQATIAYIKAKELDTKGNYTSDIKKGMTRISVHSENKGVADYNVKKYAEALSSFERAYQINGPQDTSNLSNCALVAQKIALNDKAKLYYQKMIDANVGQGKTFKSLVDLYLELKDTVGGMVVLSKGRNMYPNDLDLLISETNYFLKINNSEKALANLNQAIKTKPGDPNLYLVRGSTYDNLANPKDTKGKELEKPQNYNELLSAAENDYKKALELNPDYFEALFNLGALYFNDGVFVINKSYDIKDPAKAKIEEDKANVLFNKSVTPLEKALEVNPKDRGTLLSLKQIYSRLQLNEKLKTINEKLK